MAKKRRKTSKRTTQVSRAKQPEWQKNPVPKKLFNAFKKISDADWEDEKLYEKYTSLADEFLGVFAEETLEQGKLIVCLTRMQLGSMNLDFTYNS